MPLIFCSTIFALIAAMTYPALAEESESAEENGVKQELTQEELDARIGRMGEAETVPEGFSFSDAENRLWLDDHLSNIDRPVRLYYEFVKSGSYEEGFTDAVYLDIIKINEDGSKNAVLDFFTAARKQVVSPENVTNIRGNPVLAIFMQGDVYEMNRLTEGHWRHFQKMIKIALRENATVEPVTFDFNGKEVNGEKISFSPYLNDPHRKDFEQFAQKTYEFILSDEIPGTLYQIKTVVKNPAGPDKGPLLEEVLTLVETIYQG
jgi:hypothetical protein